MVPPAAAFYRLPFIWQQTTGDENNDL